MNYVCNMQSECVLSSGTRKLPLNMKTKWLTYRRQNDTYYMGLEAFSLWWQEVAAVHEDVLMTGNPNADKSKWTSNDKLKNSTFSTFADDSATRRPVMIVHKKMVNIHVEMREVSEDEFSSTI